jgi:ribosome maturation factor RimP
MSVPRARVEQVLRPVVAETGADLEDVSVSAAGRRSVVRVVVDRDGGISLDDVAEISRVVSAALDELDEAEPGLLGTSYVLEVSSPGVDRPLTAPGHWRGSAGRLVTAVLREGADVTGRVVSADTAEDGSVRLDVDGTTRTLAYTDIARGKVQVEFRRDVPAGDADDSEEETT